MRARLDFLYSIEIAENYKKEVKQDLVKLVIMW